MLLKLHREIDARTREIASSHGSWPCREGCDHCCRNLAEPPRLTRAEWELVEEGLAKLPLELQGEIRQRAATAGRTCPFLDGKARSCLIYENRPVACRTYGFYVERDKGLYCREIERRVEAGEMANVVWGNITSVEAQLDALSEKIPLTDWFRYGLAHQFPRPD